MNQPAQTDYTVLNMASDLRHQLQELNRQLDELLHHEPCAEELCFAQRLIALISATTMTQTVALELVHRLTACREQGPVCPGGCQGHCPWFHGAQRVERWFKEPAFEPGEHKLALYDFQRGVSMALNLADYFELNLQQVAGEMLDNGMDQAAFCLSSWLRKLVQLLNRIGAHAGCPEHKERRCI